MFAYSLGHNRVFGEAAGASELAAGYQIGPNNAKFEPGAPLLASFARSGIAKMRMWEQPPRLSIPGSISRLGEPTNNFHNIE